MTTSLSVIARRAVLTASRRAPPCVTFLKCLSSKSGKLPDEEYYEGHLLADHLEFLDDMIERTIKIEESMEGLKDTYSKKKDAYNNVGFTTSAEIDLLFDTAKMQKDELSGQIAELREMMAAAKAKGYAVDAPDGTSDAMRKENLKQVNQIIDYAATHEDKEQILFDHKMSMRGVEAPDGTSDAMRLENLKQAKRIIENVHDKEEFVGVDAPDGTPDAMEKETLKQVEEIIDFAAEHEDKDKIEYEHKMENAVRKEQARDPERDW